MKSYMK